MRDTLRHLVFQCRGDGPLDGCPIIDAVLEGARNQEVNRRIRRGA